jgi:phenylacetate-CoA ligase
LRLLEQSQWWTAQKLAELRHDKLRRLILHCYRQVPYYRQVMDEAALKPSDFSTLADLAKMPVLTKQVLRANAARLQPRDVKLSRTSLARTGGTTGEPIQVRRYFDDAVWSTQCHARGLSWSGLMPTTKYAKLFGGSLGQGAREALWRRVGHRLVGDPLFLPAFELRAQNVRDYVERIKRTGCRYVIGYASVLYLLADLIENTGCPVPPLKAVFSTAELMPPHWQAKIESVLRCPVLCYYGCGEVNALGYQCGQGEGYHRCDEHAVLEVEDAAGRTSLSGEGAFLVSDLDNYAMPILRYRNGDAGVLSEEPCPCGRSGGRILRLDGRVNDFLYSRDGSAISGAIAAHTFRLVKGVALYQYVQQAPGHITVRIVRDPDVYDAAEEEAKIRAILKDHLGADTSVSFEYPPDIERTPAGKARFVISACGPAAGAGGAIGAAAADGGGTIGR